MSDYEAFILLVRYMESFDMAGLYRPTLDGVELWLFIFDRFMEEELPALFRHFTELGIKSDMVFSQWFMTFFAYRFPLSFVFRMMDVFFMFGWPAIISLSLYLLHFNEKVLLAMTSFESVIEFLRRKVIEPYRGDAAAFIRDALSWALSKSLLTLTSSQPRVWKRIKAAKAKFMTLNSPIVVSLLTENQTLLALLRDERERAAKQQKYLESGQLKSRSMIASLKAENETLQLQVREISQALAESRSALTDLIEKHMKAVSEQE